MYSANIIFYTRAWQIVLTRLLGWSDSEVSEWAQQWVGMLDDDCSWFYHESPGYYMALPLLESYCGCALDSLSSEMKLDMLRDYLAKVNGKELWDLDDNDVNEIRIFLDALNDYMS